jgi:hypothetical protein
MASPGEKQILPAGKDQHSSNFPELNKFVTLLPELYYAVNRVLEDCTQHFSKKVGVALLALESSTQEDSIGKYLSISDLNRIFRDWYVVSENSAGSQVAKVKSDLFDLGFIKIEGGADHIHLTAKGEEAVQRMHAVAINVIAPSVGVLSPDEQRILLDFAKRMIATKKPPGKETLPLGFPAS